MNIQLQPGDWYERDGKWWYMSADGESERGPFDTEDEAKSSLGWEAMEAFLD